jgi:hypothetical protein
MEQRHERLVEELRIAERARELLAELEWHLKNRKRADLENHLRQLDQLAGSLPEGHVVRLVVENAAAHARARGAGKAGSVASRSRSKTEGRVSTLQGILDRQDAFASMDA